MSGCAYRRDRPNGLAVSPHSNSSCRIAAVARRFDCLYNGKVEVTLMFAADHHTLSGGGNITFALNP